MELSYCIDYLTVTTKDKKSVIRHPKLTDLCEVRGKGMFGYNEVLDYADGRIEAYSTKNPDTQGRMMGYGGSALRRASEVGLSSIDLLRWHHAMLHNFTRVDFAIDVYDSGLDIDGLVKMKNEGRIDTNTKSFHYSWDTAEGKTFYVGYTKPKMVRIYDKAAEQKVSGDWKRIEGQYRKEYAFQVGEAIANAENPAKAITGHIKGFVDFPDCQIWQKIMSEEKMKVSELPKVGGKTMEWLLGDVAKAIAKMKTGDYPDVMQMLERAVNEEIGLQRAKKTNANLIK